MPRGGHNAKPLALHLKQGTYRPSRHGKTLEMERRLRLMKYPPQNCATCRHEFEEGEPIAANEAETVGICLPCVAGAVVAYGAEVLDIVPRELIEEYVKGQPK